MVDKTRIACCKQICSNPESMLQAIVCSENFFSWNPSLCCFIKIIIYDLTNAILNIALNNQSGFIRIIYIANSHERIYCLEDLVSLEYIISLTNRIRIKL